MGTFFEKLTSAAPASLARRDAPAFEAVEEEAAEAVSRPAPKRRAPRVAAKERDTDAAAAPEHDNRARTAQLREEAEAEIAARPAEEEEGELTVDIYDKGDAIMIQSTVAGVKPEDLDVSITSDTVTIRGLRRFEDEVQEDDYYYKELFWGRFSRSVILPEEIEDDEAEASLKNGLLTIRLPKKKRGVVQKVKVKMN